MLKTDPISLFDNEIRPSERLRDRVIVASSEIVKEFHGAYYRTDRLPASPAPENHWYEWLNTIKPQVIYDNPKVKARSARSGPHRQSALAMEAGINTWTKRVRLWRTLDRIFDDSAFSYGVARVAYEPATTDPMDGGSSAIPYRPVVRRTDPGRWFCDHSADVYDPLNGDGRYAGHIWWRDKDDLMNDPRYNADAVKELAADADLKKRDRNYGKDATERNEIIAYELWIPEIQSSDDPNAHGTLYTLATAQKENGDMADPKWIRDPRPFIGPRTGPYVLFGYHFVPNCPYPLSPFAAVYEQVKELNAHAASAARSAANSKKIALVDSTQQAVANTIQETPDGGVAIVTGAGGDLSKVVMELDLGEVRQGAFEYLDRLQSRRDRVTGLSDADRGNVTGDPTATEIANAASQRNARTSLLRKLFTEGVRDTLHSAGFYLFEMQDAVFPLDQETANQFVPRPRGMPPLEEAERVAEMMGAPVDYVRQELDWSPRAVYAGGPADDPVTEVVDGVDGEVTHVVSPNAGGLSYEDLELEIEPYSMERVDEGLLQRNTQAVAALLPALLTAAAQHPALRLPELIDMVGDPLNMPDLSDRVLDKGLLEQQRAAMLMGVPGGGGGPPMGPGAGGAALPVGATATPPATGPQAAAQQGSNLLAQSARGA